MKRKLFVPILCMALVLAMLTSAFAVISLPTSAHVHQYVYAGKVFRSCEYINPTYHQTTYTYIYTCSVPGCGDRYLEQVKSPLEVHNGTYCTACHRQIIMDVPGEIMGVDDEHDC